MKIAGFQKLSLIDYPGKAACTLFLFGCNFRCGFCHNPELVVKEKPEKVYSEQEILDFLKKRKNYLDGVCITGGEPLINSDIGKLISKIKEMGYDIKIDTNGSNPELLKQLIEKKLVDYVALDIKADKDNYGLLAGNEVEINKIEESIKILINSNIEHEFRTTAVKGYHDKEILGNIGKWLGSFGKIKKYIIQNFIAREGKLIDKEFEKIKSFNEQELEGIREKVKEYFEKVEIRG